MAPKRKQAVVEPPVTRIWFMVVDHGFRRTLTDAISVRIPSDSFFEDFLAKIKASDHEILREAGNNLQVWKLRDPQQSMEIKEEGYLTNLRRLASSKEGEQYQDQDQDQEQGPPQGDEVEEDEEKKKREKEKGKEKEKEKPKEKKGDAASQGT